MKRRNVFAQVRDFERGGQGREAEKGKVRGVGLRKMT